MWQKELAFKKKKKKKKKKNCTKALYTRGGLHARVSGAPPGHTWEASHTCLTLHLHTSGEWEGVKKGRRAHCTTYLCLGRAGRAGRVACPSWGRCSGAGGISGRVEAVEGRLPHLSFPISSPPPLPQELSPETSQGRTPTPLHCTAPHSASLEEEEALSFHTAPPLASFLQLLPLHLEEEGLPQACTLGLGRSRPGQAEGSACPLHFRRSPRRNGGVKKKEVVKAAGRRNGGRHLKIQQRQAKKRRR